MHERDRTIRGARDALLDEPLALSAALGDELVWRARLRDDDNRVWKGVAARSEDLPAAWAPAKTPSAPIAALASLRPVALDIRAEAAEGRAVARTVTRRLVGPGVRLRRWPAGRLHLPAGEEPCATVLLDGRSDPTPATLAAPLLASRGALVLLVLAGDPDAAAERLARVPGATEPVLVAPLLPPGVPALEPTPDRAAWDALLERLGARFGVSPTRSE